MFHAQDGLMFERRPGGSVHIEVRDETDGAPRFQTDLSPETWASAVASVSRGGDTSGQFQAALEFHQIYDHDETLVGR